MTMRAALVGTSVLAVGFAGLASAGAPYGAANRSKGISLEAGMAVISAEVGGLQWFTRADFADPRTGSGVEGASASLIGDTIYVSHGHRNGDTVLLSAYDIASDSWTHGGAGLPDAPGTQQSEMGGGTADGDHYAIGGRNGPSDEVHRFTPGAGWTTVASLPAARGGLGVASWAGRIYAIGGRDGGGPFSGNVFGTNEVYDPDTNSWSPLAPLPIPVADNYATLAHDGRIYVFGGWDGVEHTAHVQIYDIASDDWSSGAPMPTPRSAAMAGVLVDEIAVFGGSQVLGEDVAEGEGENGCLDVTELYDPIADAWRAGPAMPVPACEIAQGVTWSANSVFAVGSGIFGASLVVVQELRGTAVVQAIPALSWGVPVFAVILLLAASALLLRRSRRAA